MIKKALVLCHTVKYLKPIQLRYRIWNALKSKLQIDNSLKGIKSDVKQLSKLNFLGKLKNEKSYISKNKFEFLSIEHFFELKIDWNFSKYGKLWTYNLNYFDFLRQKDFSTENGLYLIKDFKGRINRIKDGLEPYPISLRSINWILFLSERKVKDDEIDTVLYRQLKLLEKKLEYHLLGNHLLENGFALLFGAYYFNDTILYKKAKNILKAELKEQVLDDGCHFELSPMYHCLMTYRVLDCYNLILNNNPFEKELLPFFKKKAELMLAFLDAVTFKNGNVPLVNDAAFGIAPTPSQLKEYARHLGIGTFKRVKLSESGYRKFEKDEFELFIDIGEVGPTYQPGHAHADTFSFELYIRNRPIIIDTGTSTYDVNKIRFYERSTKAHNTVSIKGENSSQVWAGHRVGERAKVNIIEDTKYGVMAEHNGYLQKFGVKHKRAFNIKNASLEIKDDIGKEKGLAYFHLAPSEEVYIIKDKVKGEDFEIHFENHKRIDLISSHYAPEFNKRIENRCLKISFERELKTKVVIV